MSKTLDLLLVNPGNQKKVYGKLSDSLSGIEPPFWCGLIAGFIRSKGFSVKIIDADCEDWSPGFTAKKIIESDPLLTYILVLGTNPSASSTPKMEVAGEILSIIKKDAPGLKTILGGLHPSALPEETLKKEKVDFLCAGEGFYTISELLELLKNNKKQTDYNIKGLWYIKNDKIIGNPMPAPMDNLDGLPFVAWDLMSMEKYRAHNWHCFQNIDERQPYAVIYTSLGCAFNCGYCPIHAFYGKPGIRFRSPGRVVEEIDYLVKNYKVKNIKFMDELFAFKEKRVIEICDLLIKRKYDLNIWAYARVDTVNENILKKMKEAGINWLSYGIESASKKVREGVYKKFNQEKIKNAIEMTHDAGINIIGNFLFGLPDDDMNTMQETYNLAKELSCEYVNFYVVMAYPGSKLYEEAVRKGMKLPDTWQGYSQYGENTFPADTKHLSNYEVLKFRDRAFNDYFSSPEYLDMIEKKFGLKVVNHIKDMLKHKIHRKLLA